MILTRAAPRFEFAERQRDSSRNFTRDHEDFSGSQRDGRRSERAPAVLLMNTIQQRANGIGAIP